jgi:hypothetical protein
LGRSAQNKQVNYTMNDTIIELAKQAGFVFWNNEPHGPGPNNIDWSCDYSNEFDKFSKLLIEQTIKQYKLCE